MSDERIFHCIAGSAHKFWSVTVTGVVQSVRWGRIGTAGQSLSRTFENETEAFAATERIIAAKRLKGYVELTPEQARAVPPASPPPLQSRRTMKGGTACLFQLPLPFDAVPLTPAIAPPARDTLSLDF